MNDALYRRCERAIRERDALGEHGRRDLGPEQVRAHVEALGQLVRLARRARGPSG